MGPLGCAPVFLIVFVEVYSRLQRVDKLLHRSTHSRSHVGPRRSTKGYSQD